MPGAHWTLPTAVPLGGGGCVTLARPLTVGLEVGLEVEALQVSTVAPSGGQGDAAEGQRAQQRHLK